VNITLDSKIPTISIEEEEEVPDLNSAFAGGQGLDDDGEPAIIAWST
jgi:hypothetical protein